MHKQLKTSIVHLL